MPKQIAIVDYGMGNLNSVAHAVRFLGYSTAVVRDAAGIENAAALILPGVGAFGEAMRRLQELALVEPLTEQVMDAGKPVLGICLGMQIMGRYSTEGGKHQGLGWIPGYVDRIPEAQGIRLPHVGWNGVEANSNALLFKNIPQETNFFFDHSYCLFCDESIVEATAIYGSSIIAAVRKDNILATQFHPEKSQNNGLRVLRNFLNFVETAVERAA